MTDTVEIDFYDTIPTFDVFEGVADEGNYRRVPDDWLVAIADIVDSTGAVAAGRYKSVNMAGASVISAVSNALSTLSIPFVFGGDGAMACVPGATEAVTRRTLAAVNTWVTEDMGLTMRTALVPVSDIRAQGLDIRVARFQVSTEVSYAMFAGGGVSWAEAEMKAGRYLVDAAPAGSKPDLTGLSCRFNPMKSRHGSILSIIAVPTGRGDEAAFQTLIADIALLAADAERGGHPVPETGPAVRFSLAGVEPEVRASSTGARRILARLWVGLQVIFAYFVLRSDRNIGSFDTRQYKRDVAANSDFRKFDDGLKMTLDVSHERRDQIEARLRQGAVDGICRYGLHSQEEALMTCIVPTSMSRDHMHFIDGAEGGYAMAATKLKAA